MTPQQEHRTSRVKDGYDTVLRVIAVINAKFGTPSATKLLTTQVTQIDKGQNYEPDMEIFVPEHYGVEVKGMHVTWHRTTDEYDRINRLKLPRTQWFTLIKWCTEHDAEPLLIIEIKTKSIDIPFLYRKIKREPMALLSKRYAKNWISPNVWQILEIGEKL
jgi:hypothetical protein